MSQELRQLEGKLAARRAYFWAHELQVVYTTGVWVSNEELKRKVDFALSQDRAAIDLCVLIGAEIRRARPDAVFPVARLTGPRFLHYSGKKLVGVS